LSCRVIAVAQKTGAQKTGAQKTVSGNAWSQYHGQEKSNCEGSVAYQRADADGNKARTGNVAQVLLAGVFRNDTTRQHAKALSDDQFEGSAQQDNPFSGISVGCEYSVANCALSPSSVTKLVPKIVNRVLKSIVVEFVVAISERIPLPDSACCWARSGQCVQVFVKT
jgi:hypothetical protein